MEYLGYAVMGLGVVIILTALGWQIVEAFRDGAGWGVFSILGLCLCWLPNLIWCLAKWDRGWRVLVGILGSLPPLFIGATILMFERAMVFVSL